MNLIAELATHNRKITDIKRIYHGLCNCCRCGCGGRYFDAGTVGFKRALNKIQKPDFKPLAEGTEVIAPAHGHSIVKSEGIVYDRTYLDIPYNKDNDKCFCLYFG